MQKSFSQASLSQCILRFLSSVKNLKRPLHQWGPRTSLWLRFKALMPWSLQQNVFGVTPKETFTSPPISRPRGDASAPGVDEVRALPQSSFEFMEGTEWMESMHNHTLQTTRAPHMLWPQGDTVSAWQISFCFLQLSKMNDEGWNLELKLRCFNVISLRDWIIHSQICFQISWQEVLGPHSHHTGAMILYSTGNRRLWSCITFDSGAPECVCVYTFIPSCPSLVLT